MKNKIMNKLSLLLALLIVLAVIPSTAFAADSYYSGSCGDNAFWEYNEETKTLTVFGSGAIPSYKATSCGPWSEFVDEIEHIIIEEGITLIGHSAFEGCYNLKQLDLPSSLVGIDQNAFYKCEGSLDRVVIPENVTYIGCNAFAGWTNGYEPYHITYVYFLGDAPKTLKEAGKISNSFSEFTTLYYLPWMSGWYGATFNGYHIEPWDGINFVDNNYTGKDDEPGQDEWDGTYDIDYDECDLLLDVAGTQCYSYAYTVIDEVNELRTELGLDELHVDSKLMELAMQRAAECSVYYSHTRPNDTSCTDIFPAASIVGENIAAGQNSPSEVMSQWIASPGHYANITESRFTNIGVGCFFVDGTYYWVQSFSDGARSQHNTHSDEEVVVSVPVNFNHLSVGSTFTQKTLRVGESQNIEIFVRNTGFGNTATPALIPIDGFQWTSGIISFDPETLSVTAISPGTAALTLNLPDNTTLDFKFTVLSIFTDVKQTDWYHEAVEYVYNKGLMQGTSSSTFSPDTTTTRAMIATILYNLEGRPDTYRTYFDDVPSNMWYADAVSWMASVGIARGYGNGKFGPNDSLTREQSAVILYNYAKYKGFPVPSNYDLSNYYDASSVSSFATTAIKWAVGNGVIKGTESHMLTPQGATTRAQIATILMNFCEKVG